MSTRILLPVLLMITLVPTFTIEAQNPFSRFEESIKGLTDAVIELLNLLKSSALTIGRVMAGTLIALGVVLWGSDVFSYRGKKLILAGLILIIVMEMIAS
ncbi:MAG: hypothetical protein RMI85_04860 [Candidatus Korarchaeum sp.]|nr:hypothetical protein [Candidatus Korarchaeum sp.]